MENKLNVQAQMQKLKEIVEKMESVSLSLEESLALYEEGIAISKDLENALKEAETKVEQVINTK